MPSMNLPRPTLKTKPSFIRLDDKQLEQNLEFLERMYEDILAEYRHMDNPIKASELNSSKPQH
jgi:hypothetical protein